MTLEERMAAASVNAKKLQEAISKSTCSACLCIVNFKDEHDPNAPSAAMINGDDYENTVVIAQIMNQDERVANIITKAFILFAMDKSNSHKTFSVADAMDMARTQQMGKA